MSLESKLEKTEKKLLISPEKRQLIYDLTSQLKEHHKPTYEHSARVALKCVEIAEVMEMGINASRAMYYGGFLHDIGKLSVSREILQKKDFDEKDMTEMRPHSQIGYLMLKDKDLLFSAMISLMHHTYKKEGYPSVKHFNPRINPGKLNRYAKIISLVDCYDAIKNRPNGSGLRFNKEKVITKLHDIYGDANMSRMTDLYFRIGLLK